MMVRSKAWIPDLGALLLLLILPLILFWPVTVGSRTLIPADNLYQWEPYRSFATEQGVELPPHNELISDLVLENLVWKTFIVESIQDREIPLWNPHLFGGIPFLAAGQHSAVYPLSFLFYILPLPRAYGLFTVLQLWMAGISMYVLARVLRQGRFAALIAAIVYQLSAFFLVSVVFTMILAASTWLPLLLAVIERMIQKQEEKGAGAFVPIIYVVLGALALGIHVLAGHPEILVYTLLVMAYYALVRLIMLWRQVGSWRPALRLGLWLAFMVGLGLGLGSIQLIPLFELVTSSFREGSVAYNDVVGWAFPTRQVFTFLIPNFFGNPAHHGYWDLVSGQWVEVENLFWGIKNYVEAGSYVGILPLVLAVVAVVGARKPSAHRRSVGLFAALAVISLLLIFGTPLYALLYYGLPGINQLHSPFRWVFPYTLSMAVLAGFGVRYLQERFGATSLTQREWRDRALNLLTWTAMGAGGALVLALLVVRAAPTRFVPWADRLVAAVSQAQEVFSGGQALLSYEWPHLLVFGVAVWASGVVLWLSRCRIHLPQRLGRAPLWQPLALIVVAVDLLVFGAGFNPAADPAWLDFTPPSIQFLKDRAAEGEPWRLTTYQAPGSTKTLNANIPWLHGLEDVRGYDSIILRQYVDYMSAIEEQGELLYNRIAPIYGVEHLSSPLVDLLNVRYVMTEGEIPNPDYALVYDDEVRIYENRDVLPRAFALPQAEVVTMGDLRPRLSAFDPRKVVLLDAEMVSASSLPQAEGPTDWPLQPAHVVVHTPNTVFVDVEMLGPGWLVLADSYFSGWKAYRSDPSDQPATPDAQYEPPIEHELQIVRADGNFRAVWLEAGVHRVRFKFTPMSFKLGLYGSFMAGVMLFLLVLYWLWGRFYRERDDDPTVKRVAKNSLIPMGLQLLNKVLDFAFAMLMLRILAPELAGRYYFAVSFIGYFDILVRFGLGTLLTREVAKDRSQGNRYLSVVTVLRALLWLLSLPLMTLVVLLYAAFGQMTTDIVMAIALFALALFFSNLADGVSAVFYAHEKMEYPAAIATLTALTRVSLGALALLLGWGFVGLAGVSVVANVFSVATLGILMARHCFKPQMDYDPQTGRWMMNTSFPLMINLLLATVFFRINVLLLKPIKGDTVVGYYSAALKYVDGLLIIPQYLTQAIFPLMSRYAATSRDSLMRAYVLSLRLLLIIALPIAAGMPFVAEGLILVLGGGKYLPHSQIALQLVIWFLPFSFVNSVTQYVLIAIDQQRFLTKAFLIGVTFNVIANLLVIQRYSYQGVAVVTILSEWALLIPFYYAVRKHLGTVPWLSLVWQPAVASAVMVGAMWLLRDLSWILLIVVAVVVYPTVLGLIGGFRQRDMDLLWRLIPFKRLHARLFGAPRG
jgi:O-antigen/teichoic acid export membrane protein